MSNEYKSNYIGSLQTWCSRTRRPSPKYTVISHEEDSSPAFTIAVYSGTHKLGQGTGSSKKLAKTAAACDAIALIGEDIVHEERVVRQHVIQKRIPQKKLRIQSDSRRSDRGSVRGYAFEDTMERYLQELLVEGKIESYARHEHFSEKDIDGKDFTVCCGGVTISFGVTTSPRSARRATEAHPLVQTLWFPHNTKPDTAKMRILNLF